MNPRRLPPELFALYVALADVVGCAAKLPRNLEANLAHIEAGTGMMALMGAKLWPVIDKIGRLLG